MPDKARKASGTRTVGGYEIDAFICRADNYAVLIHDSDSDATCSIDAPDSEAIAARLAERGWSLDLILVTHRHGDHVAGNAMLKEQFGCRIVGPDSEAGDIPAIDQGVGEGDSVPFGRHLFEVIETPGHTAGHVSYVDREAGLAFVGDTLFSLGCGRLFGNSAELMWQSLKKLAALPRETLVYCGHEYTEKNGEFAETVEPNNIDLQARIEEVRRIRAEGGMTLPTTMGLELMTNPFLRADKPRLKAAIGMESAEPADVFRVLRQRKDAF